MATRFDFFFTRIDAAYAKKSAQAGFDEIDRLEAELSQWIDGSEISALNGSPANKAVQLSLDTFACLQLAVKMNQETSGVFDPTIGRLLNCYRDKEGKYRTPGEAERRQAAALCGMAHLKLDSKNMTATKDIAELSIDLGGIAKGFALDAWAKTLKEDWEIDGFLLNGGDSSLVAARGPEESGWRVKAHAPLNLKQQAMAASGFSTKGSHILDPRTQRPIPQTRERLWAFAANGAESDALSTAFMIFTDDEIRKYLSEHKNVGCRILKDGAVEDMGTVPGKR